MLADATTTVVTARAIALAASTGRRVISMTSSTREGAMLWVAAIVRRCERALRPVCTALASSSVPTSLRGERCRA